ncbi:efflux RND transporter permease subunit [Desulfoluna spongiiphila]|uniref:Multidrug efflux pump subunit AcrB n=1 Tax=Desulfoluna spongiiphila TaxID=419481 RepID=A0A1G5I732_9BACT|nr:efflux RND transporter permease subunit [Desulfoluna spongiiphila]SCY71995.1 Multidrug efflux pump subunit AcrB [Desulfoluna spongiiphila]
MMHITEAAIRMNRVTLVMILMVVLGGWVTLHRLPQDEDPGYIIRVAMVTTYFPGASPERVEQLVTDRLEKAIQEISELDYVESESRPGISIIYVNIDESYKNMRPLWDELRRKVDRETPRLPEGVIGPFVNDDFGDVFGQVLALTGEGYTYRELKEVADEVRDELLRIDNVAKVEIIGVQEEQVFLEFNSARLARYGISPLMLQQVLSQRNIITPGGALESGQERINLEPTGNFEAVAEILDTVISVPGRKEVVYLKDLVAVTRGYQDPPSTLMRFNGAPALALAVSMSEGGDIIALGKEVTAFKTRLEGLYPIGVAFHFLARQPERVHRSVSDFLSNLMQSIAIVCLVMLVSLGLRTGLLVASLIPVTILMAFMLMGFFGIGIDQVSLTALLISLGILVDNAIVMSESIMTQVREGQSVAEAAVTSARELARPLLTASLTTSFAFLPIYMAKSSTGEYTAPLFKVVTLTLLSSWVLALTMIPLFCVRFLRVKGQEKESAYNSPFYTRYRRALMGVLRHRRLFVAAMCLAFVIAMVGFRYVPKRFMPDSDRRIITATVETPPGSDIAHTEAMVKRVEGFIRENLMAEEGGEGVVNWGSFVGEGAPRFILSYRPDPPESSFSYLLINTTSFEAVAEVVTRLQDFCDAELPEVRAKVSRLSVGPPVNHPVAVRISGKKDGALFKLVDGLKEHLREEPGVREVGDDWGRRTRKLVVRVDQERARRAGITSRDIALSLQGTLSGVQVGQYREEDDLIPIVVRSVAEDRNDIEKLEGLRIYSLATGQSVPLSQVASMDTDWQNGKIIRRDRLRTVEVYADLYEGFNALAINEKVSAWLAEQSGDWGLGYRYEVAGEAEKSAKANQAIADELPFAGMLIMLLLVLQFNSLRRTLLLLCIVPLGLIGVTVGLLVARSYFGFMTLLGVVALSGIVINNANVLLDRIRIEIEENGLEPGDAVVVAAQRRLRPILLTTLTTVGGLIPLWVGGGPLFEPMAVSIIFGLVFATVITLGMVPALYALFFRVRI